MEDLSVEVSYRVHLNQRGTVDAKYGYGIGNKCKKQGYTIPLAEKTQGKSLGHVINELLGQHRS